MRSTPTMITADQALAGRSTAIEVTRPHLTLGVSMNEPYPAGTAVAYFGLGCFWGAERKFYETPGVVTTATGYQGGFTINPTYQEVCTGLTGHTEVVKVVFDPSQVSYAELVALFFESHDPTQGFRQGGDIGTQYRSAIYTVDEEQQRIATAVRDQYQSTLRAAGYGAITTELAPAGPFYMAEDYHQQYLTANPNGYCGLGGTGVQCPTGVAL